jgi:hypothetical protein
MAPKRRDREDAADDPDDDAVYEQQEHSEP